MILVIFFAVIIFGALVLIDVLSLDHVRAVGQPAPLANRPQPVFEVRPPRSLWRRAGILP